MQGIGFRYGAKKIADDLNLSGFARNEPDSSVYIEAEGEDAKLDEFLKWCRSGPGSAKIAGIDFDFSAATGEHRGFVVR